MKAEIAFCRTTLCAGTVWSLCRARITHVREKHDGNLATASVPRQHTELLARERSGVYWKPKGAAAERAGPSTILPHPNPDIVQGAMPCGGL